MTETKCAGVMDGKKADNSRCDIWGNARIVLGAGFKTRKKVAWQPTSNVKAFVIRLNKPRNGFVDFLLESFN